MKGSMQRSPLVWKLIALVSGLTLLAIAAGSWWAWSLTTPVSSDSSTVTFIIPRGRAIRLIGQDLQEAGLARSPWAFQYAVWRLNLQSKIQAGSFELDPSMDIYEVAASLTSGANDVWLTLKEGWRAEEIGEYAAQELTNFDTNSTAFTTECLNYEGRLFPETYLIPKTYDAAQVCQLMRREFDSVWEELLAAAPTPEYPEEELITLASIVEREARTPDEMRLVAGILYNRLELGMPLQVDASLQYSKGYDSARQTWWAPPVSLDKSVDSPYNTYQNPGLPPGPIANPGRNALSAVLNPRATDDLFYLHAPDGTMYTAPTYEGHQENIDRYLR